MFATLARHGSTIEPSLLQCGDALQFDDRTTIQGDLMRPDADADADPAADTATDMDTEHRRLRPGDDRGPSWPADAGHPRKWLILCVLAAVAFMAQLDLFIVNVAVPAMGRSFHGAGPSDLSWVLNGYAIVFGALLVPAGRLADHFGRRRFLLGGVVVFTSGSIVCAVAPSLDVLVLGRLF